MRVSFEGFGENAATFYNSQTAPAAAGRAVCISGDCEAALCTEGRPAGFAISADGEYAVVQLGGFVKAMYSGDTAPTCGWCGLSCDGEGKLCVDDAGTQFLVVEVDAAAGTVGFIL